MIKELVQGSRGNKQRNQPWTWASGSGGLGTFSNQTGSYLLMLSSGLS